MCLRATCSDVDLRVDGLDGLDGGPRQVGSNPFWSPKTAKSNCQTRSWRGRRDRCLLIQATGSALSSRT